MFYLYYLDKIVNVLSCQKDKHRNIAISLKHRMIYFHRKQDVITFHIAVLQSNVQNETRNNTYEY